MTIYILLALLIVPLLEIATFIEVGGAIGLWPTLAIVVLTALGGTALLRHQGLETLRRARADLDRGQVPVTAVFDGVCLLLAGALLLTPGFLTDGLGGLLFVPGLRVGLRRFLLQRLLASGHLPSGGAPEGGGQEVIEGDYVELDGGEGEPRSGPHDKGGHRS